MSVSGATNYADPFSRFLGPETNTFRQFLATEIVKMGQHEFWPLKLTLWISFCAQKLTHFVSFWSQLFFQEFWPIEEEEKQFEHALDYV